MNKSSCLFLFFVAVLVGPVFLFASSQQPRDSLLYYHNAIVRPQNGRMLNAAFLFFDKEIHNALTQGDTLSAVQHLRRVAIGEFELGFLYESEATAVRALELLENQNPDAVVREAKSGVLNHLGIVYRHLKAFAKALSHFELALELAMDSSDSIPALNNITYLLLNQDKYVQALKNSRTVYKKQLQAKDSIGIAKALDNMGYVQSKLDLPQALADMQRALGIRQRTGDIRGLYASNRHLSNFFFQQGNRQKALKHAEEAYGLAKQLNSASYLENALALLLDLSTDSNTIAYRKLSDSLSAAKQLQENKYATIKYNVAKERKKAQVAELKNEQEKRYKILFLCAFLVAFMLGGFLLYRKHQLRKRELVLTTQKTEARISKRVHDDLANDIYGVMTFIENRATLSNKGKEELLTFLDDIYARARDISAANARIDVSDFPGVLKNLIAQHLEGIKVITTPYSNINWDNVAEHKKTALYKSLQELLVNTKKHSKARSVTLAFRRERRKNEIVYSDDGRGLDRNTIVLGGLKNVETRMNDIGGSFSFESHVGQGFKATLLF